MGFEVHETDSSVTLLICCAAYGGLVFLQVASAPAGTVACDSGSTWKFVFDSSTPAGKVTLAQILAAYAAYAERTVRLVSTEVCSLYAGVPNLDTVTLK